MIATPPPAAPAISPILTGEELTPGGGGGGGGERGVRITGIKDDRNNYSEIKCSLNMFQQP